MRRWISLMVAAVSLTPVLAGAQSIRPDAIRGSMRFLSSDLLEGRGTGTRGYQIAAEYVASQYESLGLKPGADGTYFQSVPFLRTVADAAQTWVKIGERTLRDEIDFGAYGEPLRDVADVEAPVVFAGYGITAPERRHDDYDGMDARGKIVAFLTGGPEAFPSGAKVADFAWKLGDAVANADARPTWKKGDFFGTTFGR